MGVSPSMYLFSQIHQYTYTYLLSDVSREGTGPHCQEYIGSRLGKHLPLKGVSCTRQESFPRHLLPIEALRLEKSNHSDGK